MPKNQCPDGIDSCNSIFSKMLLLNQEVSYNLCHLKITEIRSFLWLTSEPSGPKPKRLTVSRDLQALHAAMMKPLNSVNSVSLLWPMKFHSSPQISTYTSYLYILIMVTELWPVLGFVCLFACLLVCLFWQHFPTTTCFFCGSHT